MVLLDLGFVQYPVPHVLEVEALKDRYTQYTLQLDVAPT